ncbi:MAG TPA: hypothetical protein VE503_01050 [Ornithinibacter sp.]|jgi:hypothetical protein|nr:hypothetical protein [Ornithinibacter sp.]
MSAGLSIEITLRGRVGPDLCSMLGPLDAKLVPRHTVIVVAPGEPRGLDCLLESLQKADVEVDLITT